MNEYKGRMVLRGDKPSGKGCKGKSKGKSKGKGKRGYPRHHRNPSGFAYHATEEDFACGYTAAEDDSEPYANPAYVDDEDYTLETMPTLTTLTMKSTMIMMKRMKPMQMPSGMFQRA